MQSLDLFRPSPCPKKYGLIYADPPWTYNDKCHAGERGAGYKYDLMTLEEIKGLRPMIDSLAAPDCLLAMWWVPPQPAEALAVVQAWGFTFKTMKGFTWHKLTKKGKDHFGMGNWTRANSEDCLFAVRGKPKRLDAGIRQIITAPIREHSRKPDEARAGLEKLLGDVPRIELFARQSFPGWDAWGNQVPKGEAPATKEPEQGQELWPLEEESDSLPLAEPSALGGMG